MKNTQTVQIPPTESKSLDDEKKSLISSQQRQRFPNRAYEPLLKLDNNYLQNYAEKLILEQDICKEIQQVRQEVGLITFNSLLMVPNQHGDTLLTLAAQHQCYQLIILILGFVKDPRPILADQKGKTIID